MTYGVDQCRVCGAPIPERPLTTRDQKNYLRVMKSRKPLMTEKEWRARGFKAQPTRWQMVEPADGTCYTCGTKLEFKREKMGRGVKRILCMLAIFGLLIVITYSMVLN